MRLAEQKLSSKKRKTNRRRTALGSPRFSATPIHVRETPQQLRSRIMRSVRGANTGPEMTVRRAVFALGYRYRLHVKQLPGAPDLVFPGRFKIVFVHGCFWHQHRCRRGRRMPKSHVTYWSTKLARNVARDRRTIAALRRAGWSVKVVWECQTREQPMLVRRLRTFLATI